jgi:hypothetical protein
MGIKMKLRRGFVTNSSSTSYIVIQIIVEDYDFNDSLKDKLEKVLEAENIDYIVELKNRSVDRQTGIIESEWDVE